MGVWGYDIIGIPQDITMGHPFAIEIIMSNMHTKGYVHVHVHLCIHEVLHTLTPTSTHPFTPRGDPLNQ